MRPFPNTAPPESGDARVPALIAGVAATAGAALAFAVPSVVHTVSSEPRRLVAMVALTLVLQLFSVPVYGRGNFGVSAIGILTTAFLLNTGSAMAIAVLAALLIWARRRTEPDKALFDAGNFALAAGVAGL